MNDSLRTCLWNAFLSKVFSKVTISRDGTVSQDYHVFISLWKFFFKLPLDEYERDVAERKAWYRDQFEAQEQDRIFAMLEFCYLKMIRIDAVEFSTELNSAFESCSSEYRIASGRIIKLQSSQGAKALDDSLSMLSALGFDSAKQNLVQFHQHMAELKNETSEEALNSLVAALTAVRQQMPSVVNGANSVARFLLAEKLSANDKHEFEFIVNACLATIVYLIREGVAKGVVDGSQLETLRYVPADPWGERKT